MGIQMEDLDQRFTSRIQVINDMDKQVKALVQINKEVELKFENVGTSQMEVKQQLLGKIKKNSEKIQSMALHEARLGRIDEQIEQIEKELVRLRKEGAIDYDLVCSREEYEEALERMSEIEGAAGLQAQTIK